MKFEFDDLGNVVRMEPPDPPDTLEAMQVAADLRDAVASFLNGQVSREELREAANIFDLWFLLRGEQRNKRCLDGPQEVKPADAAFAPRENRGRRRRLRRVS